MKKLSIILLALAFAVFFAGSAMAFHAGDEGTTEGALGLSGTYTVDAESLRGNDGDTEQDWYDDDLEIVLTLNQSNVTAVVDLEISDDEGWDSNDIGRPGDIVDNYYIKWQAMDALSFRIGEYGITFGKAVVIYADPQAHHIGVTYSLEQADLGFYLGKVNEGDLDDPDDDVDAYAILINVKNVDFFKKLDIIYVNVQDDSDTIATYTGLDSAFDVGPVALAIEFGTEASDTAGFDGGNFVLAQVGLDELVGFDLNVDYFNSNEDFTQNIGFGDGDYYPFMIFAWRDIGGAGQDVLNETTFVGLSGSYAIDDNTTFIGKALVQGKVADETVGTEFDLHLKRQWADNVSTTFTYASLQANDELYGTNDDTATDIRVRTVFSF